MSKARKFSRSKKSTSVKVGNKNYNRQLKSGKIKSRKKNVPKSFNNYTEQVSSNTHDSDADSVIDSSVPVDKILQMQTFLNATSQKRKHEDSNMDMNLLDCEKAPRKSFIGKKMKFLLPLKDDSGLIPQAIEVKEKKREYSQRDVTDNISEKHSVERCVEPENNLSFVELCAEREVKLKQIKEKLGMLCSSVVENPEENIRLIKDVLLMLDMNDPDVYLSVRKLACISLVELFKDILPSYKIRSVPSKTPGQKLKKETRQLREYEDSLLRYYKQFLCKLEKMLECLKSKYKVHDTDKITEAKTKARYLVAIIATKCFSELLIANPYFNFGSNILKIIVDRMSHKNSEISNISCETISTLFKGDKIGQISLEGVKLIGKLVKARNFNIQGQVLRTFLSLNVKEAEMSSVDSKKGDIKKIKKQMEMMSRKEKKQQKKMKELENELLEAEAEESKAKKSKHHTSILNQVFLVYFKVLKGDFRLELVTPVLEGLSKFAHLINIDYFDDLIAVLYNFLESEKLGHVEILHCLKSVFTILSGQGSSLNIDPQGFYRHLYNCILHANLSASDEDVTLLLQCIDLMVIQRRKKITSQRVFAFLKRISIISLSQTSTITLSLLAAIRQLFMNFKQCDILLDTENSGSGQYDADHKDPEYCNAGSTILWEFHLLTNSYHPVVCKYAKHLLLHCPAQGQGQLHPTLALKSPIEILNQFKKERAAVYSLSQAQKKTSSNNHVKKFNPCVTDVNSVTSQAVTLANSNC